MTRPREDDQEAVERAFAELVAGYHLTSDRPDPLAEPPVDPELRADPEPRSDRRPPAEATSGWANDHPLFRYQAAEPEPAQEEYDERYQPGPPPPLPAPGWPVLLAWLGMGYAVLIVLAIAVGVSLPGWAGWLAIGGFVGGFGILVAKLPRNRPPDAGDGAVL